MTTKRSDANFVGPQSDTTKEERRDQARERYLELQAALHRRHFTVHAEEAAIQRHKMHHSLDGLRRLAARGVLPGVKG